MEYNLYQSIVEKKAILMLTSEGSDWDEKEKELQKEQLAVQLSEKYDDSDSYYNLAKSAIGDVFQTPSRYLHRISKSKPKIKNRHLEQAFS